MYSSDADQLLAAAMVAYPAGYSKRMYDIWYITSLKIQIIFDYSTSSS